VRDANVCTDCNIVVSGAEAHVDHIIPLEDGGGDNDANLATRCRSCHSRKTIGEQRRKGLL
jgi:5-methylcytosine-specific restriction endonuclease McrA